MVHETVGRLFLSEMVLIECKKINRAKTRIQSRGTDYDGCMVCLYCMLSVHFKVPKCTRAGRNSKGNIVGCIDIPLTNLLFRKWSSEWLDKAKIAVEKYCKDSVMADCENTKKDNPFSYVKPEFLFVHRDKKRPRVLLVCKYRYDIEHGLAVVFFTDGDISVGPQDIIL